MGDNYSALRQETKGCDLKAQWKAGEGQDSIGSEKGKLPGCPPWQRRVGQRKEWKTAPRSLSFSPRWVNGDCNSHSPYIRNKALVSVEMN